MDGFEPMIVTEMPKALFKKPKLKNYSTDGSGFKDGEKLLKPVFAKRQSTANSRGKSNTSEYFVLSCIVNDNLFD